MKRFQTAVSRIHQDAHTRRAYIPGSDQPFTYGVNAGIAAYYGATPAREFPSTIDHVIAATAG